MVTKRACLACRIRKVRCTPATPRCLRCTELGIDECVYVSVTKRGSGNTLGMREACQPCRKRKRRCDAKGPCTPCSKEGRSDCVYERSRVKQRMSSKPPIKQPPTPAQTLPFSSGGEPSPHRSPPSRVNSKDSSPTPPTPDIDPPGTRSPVFSLSDPTLSNSSARESYFPKSDTLDELEPPVPQEWTAPEMNLVPFRESPKPHQRARISIFSVLPSLRFQSIPRPLCTSLSFLDPECFQVSDTTSSELDLTFRLAALLRLRLFGIYLPGPKQDAILRGDLSNTVVHPFFVHALAGLGIYFCADIGYSHATVLLHAKHAQRSFEQLAEISGGSDANLTVQVSFSLTSMTLHSRWLEFARICLTRTCIALNAAGLRFIPTDGRPPALTEDVREQVVVLSQLIYLESYMFLVVDGIEPKMTIRIEKEFRHDLQQTYPHLFEICPLTMRTRGILLVRDTVSTMALCSAGMKLDQRKQICDGLVICLDEYSNTLLRNVRTFLRIGDTQGAEIIQSSCVGCLAHLAALCDLIGRLEPNFRPRMDAICDSSLERLGRLTEEMRFEGYTYFDLLLKVSWERSLTVFDSRIDYLSDEENAPLRQYRKIIAEAWSDIKARLPGPTPPPLSTNLVYFDGRDEGSKYPNFMLSSERVSHGL